MTLASRAHDARASASSYTDVAGGVAASSAAPPRRWRATLNAITVTFWAITEDGPGEKTTGKLADVIDWTKLLPSFQQSYLLGLGRLPAQ